MPANWWWRTLATWRLSWRLHQWCGGRELSTPWRWSRLPRSDSGGGRSPTTSAPAFGASFTPTVEAASTTRGCNRCVLAPGPLSLQMSELSCRCTLMLVAQGFFFSEIPKLGYGLVQTEGGPCGPLASVNVCVLTPVGTCCRLLDDVFVLCACQAYVIRNLLFAGKAAAQWDQVPCRAISPPLCVCCVLRAHQAPRATPSLLAAFVRGPVCSGVRRAGRDPVASTCCGPPCRHVCRRRTPLRG